MFRAVFHASRAIRVLSVWVCFPRVRYGVITLHRRTFLSANAIVVEISTRLRNDEKKTRVTYGKEHARAIRICNAYKAIALFRSRATAGAKQMATVSGLRAETPALVTLRTAVDFRELLTVMRPFAPASTRARFVARRTFSFRIREIIHVHPLGPLTGDDLVPINGAHVAQIIVIDHADVSGQDVCKRLSESDGENPDTTVRVRFGGTLPLSAGSSRLFIFDNMTSNENSSSLTANLN